MKTCNKDIKFSGVEGPAVVVQPDVPWGFVFWRGAQYVGCIDLGGNVWFTPEWLETNSPEDNHCYEPIMDKQCKYSFAEIIEAGEARAKVRWHYACCNVKYEIFHGNTEADEYYTVYPDGIAIRKLVAWPGNQSEFGGNPVFWQVMEFILINGVGTRPDEVMDCDHAFTFMNEKGEKIVIEWPLPPKNHTPLCSLYPEIKDWKMYIGRINLKNRPNPFIAFMKDKRFFPYKTCPHCGGNHPIFGLFPDGVVWKHWPASPMENFILAAEAEEDELGKIPTHTSFIDCNYSGYSPLGYAAETPPRPTTWLFLVGAVKSSDDDKRLLEIAKSWARPAVIKTGFESRKLRWGLSYGPILYEGYSHAERAYVFRLEGTSKLKFRMEPVEKVINPVIRVERWSGDRPKVSINEKELKEDSFKWQFDGRFLTIWINGEFTEPTVFTVE